ncbi:hypothetical protein GCM10023197_28490 [Gordonia humi]
MSARLRYGLCNVSGVRGCLRLQRYALTAAGCDEVFIDHASGKLASRPQLESAFITVVVDWYLAGVSTCCMDILVKTLGINAVSKSQVSRIAADLEEHVEQFRHRHLGYGS